MSRQTASSEVVDRDQAVVTPAIYRYTDIVFARGEGVFLYDYEGRRYYDMAAGIATMDVGHCHPRVVQAITDQAKILIHGASHIGYMLPYIELLERVLGLAPAPLTQGKGLLMNSGGEAVETAVKLARAITGRSMVLAFLDSFHGRPMGALALTASSSVYRRHLSPLLVGVEHVPYPNCYRCPFGHGSHTTDQCCGSWRPFIEMTLNKLLHPDDLAAIIVEPIIGEGGYLVPPDDFLPALREICDRTGALLICDEVQTGLGRTGKWFAFEHWNVLPDVIALGKAIGGGLPLGAAIARAELMDAWWPAAHGTTFGGNPIACAAGLETLAIIEEDGLLDNATAIGDHIQARFRAAQSEFAIIGQVRGKGLMIAVDLVNAAGEAITTDQVKHIIKKLGGRGVVMTKCGQSALRIAPALNLAQDQADAAVDIILEVLREVSPEILEAKEAVL
ncbi:MAG TPA: aminotransferase class III-fold pyridoxal phosphate-dependent enzyme [Anaerolineales bacterium]|nr:aminotransferase class III-fold pyridoxal phosphate-dependent enzyme [Anaerolineales bacterium]